MRRTRRQGKKTFYYYICISRINNEEATTTVAHDEARQGTGPIVSPFNATALRAVEHGPEPLADPPPLRHARAVVLAVAAAAVDHEAVWRVAAGGADAVGGGFVVVVVAGTVAAVLNHALSAHRVQRTMDASESFSPLVCAPDRAIVISHSPKTTHGFRHVTNAATRNNTNLAEKPSFWVGGEESPRHQALRNRLKPQHYRLARSTFNRTIPSLLVVNLHPEFLS